MGKELSRICQVSSVGVLADQMAEAEQSKSEVETLLQERVGHFWIRSSHVVLDCIELFKSFGMICSNVRSTPPLLFD